MNEAHYRAICALMDRSAEPVRLVTDERRKSPAIFEARKVEPEVRLSSADHDDLVRRLLAEHRGRETDGLAR